MGSTKLDNEIEKLLELAKSDKVEKEERKAPSVLDDFILEFELEPSDKKTLPIWSLYRAYRLWQKKPLSKQLFSREFKKHFRLVKSYERELHSKSYYVTGNIDVSEAAYWAEKRHEAEKRSQKERARKEKYPENYPGRYFSKETKKKSDS